MPPLVLVFLGSLLLSSELFGTLSKVFDVLTGAATAVTEIINVPTNIAANFFILLSSNICCFVVCVLHINY